MWLVLSFELSQRQNVPHVAPKTIFTTQGQQTIKKGIKNEVTDMKSRKLHW